LICDDPDAPSPQRPAKNPWVHWVIFDVPAQLHELPEGISRVAHPAEVTGATQGINSWSSDNLGYRGPAPPPGSGPHHYYFKLYALDTKLGKHADGADKSVLLSNIKGHVLAEAELMGTYERKA
jgi:Raf kinase inhibitor-like YbhB/YbcL family protein